MNISKFINSNPTAASEFVTHCLLCEICKISKQRDTHNLLTSIAASFVTVFRSRHSTMHTCVKYIMWKHVFYGNGMVNVNLHNAIVTKSLMR